MKYEKTEICSTWQSVSEEKQIYKIEVDTEAYRIKSELLM